MPHTPGPWLTEASSYGDEIEVYPKKGGPPPVGRWAEICTVKDYESQEEMEANARLIAASPDLLSACRCGLIFVEEIESIVGFTSAAGIALRSIIAKATGNPNGK